MSVKAKLDEMQVAYNRLCAEYGHSMAVVRELQAVADAAYARAGDAGTQAEKLRDRIVALRAEHAKLTALVDSPEKAPSEAAAAEMVGG